MKRSTAYCVAWFFTLFTTPVSLADACATIGTTSESRGFWDGPAPLIIGVAFVIFAALSSFLLWRRSITSLKHKALFRTLSIVVIGIMFALIYMALSPAVEVSNCSIVK